MAQQCPFLNKLTLDILRASYAKKGYPFFEKGQYNVNLFGIRNTDNPNSDKFNDLIGLAYKDEDNDWILKRYQGTTDPSVYYRKNPMNSAGTAILVPGFYRGAYKIGIHRNKYEALRQRKPMKYYRDNNKDGVLDFDEGTIVSEVAFTNVHRAATNGIVESVGPFSAGCQVVLVYDEFLEMMRIMRKARDRWGNAFSYTLFLQNEMVWDA